MISCELHDYIEIACTYAYPLKLILKNTDEVVGRAKDIVLDDQRHECLVLDTPSGLEQVQLDQISAMQAQVSNPHFSEVNFT